jgi:plasmid stabilization system protein ParE
MNYKISVSTEAKKNLKDATNFYSEKAGKSVALNFLNDYKHLVSVLKINQYFQIRYKNYRALPFSKFPYIAFFIVDEPSKTIFINAIFHTSQNPSKYP